MKLKLDENLPESLVQELSASGHDVDTVRHEGVAGQSDPNVWRSAQDNGRFFITQDLDFSDIRRSGQTSRFVACPPARTGTARFGSAHWRSFPCGRYVLLGA